jgi:hypothetical protein
MIYGLGLPDEVLEKAYHRNAEALFAQLKSSERRAEPGGWARHVGCNDRRDASRQIALDSSGGHQ